jgi:hypothetical protein
LPSAEEARANPELVITLDPGRPDPDSGPAANPYTKLEPAPRALATARNMGGLEFEPDPSSEVTPELDLPPVDLPPAGTPEQPARPASPAAISEPVPDRVTAQDGQPAGWATRLRADTVDALRCLATSLSDYRGRWRTLLFLTAAFMLPAVAVESCLTVAFTSSLVVKPAAHAEAAAAGLSQRREELNARIEESRARGWVDRQAQAELAALDIVIAAGKSAGASAVEAEAAARPGRAKMLLLRFVAALFTGLLLFGAAVPLAYAANLLVIADERAGLSRPELADVWPLLLRRAELFLCALPGAAVIIALGYALFFVPGLVASVLLAFVPAVVLFERRTGKLALLRSLHLVKSDPVRVTVVLLAAGLASAIVFRLADLVISDSGRRLLFMQALLGNLLFVAITPVFAAALARIYAELRDREGVTAEDLARAARR